jgi:hypothetical protein
MRSPSVIAALTAVIADSTPNLPASVIASVIAGLTRNPGFERRHGSRVEPGMTVWCAMTMNS